MLFCAAGTVFLLAAWPQYAKRQRRLEMQYHARQEIARRQVEGTAPAREPGEEGSAPPPVAGELIISLWPLVALFAALFAISAALLWRNRRPWAVASSQPIDGAEP
jgi:hypothetical protein